MPGVAISDAQVAALTTSIVWMVEKEATLDNGKKTVVLASKITNSTHLIAGGAINITI